MLAKVVFVLVRYAILSIGAALAITALDYGAGVQGHSPVSAACNRILNTGHGFRIPCAHTKPCPLHDRERIPYPDEDSFIPWSVRASMSFSAGPQAGRTVDGGVLSAPPLPRLFDEWEAA